MRAAVVSLVAAAGMLALPAAAAAHAVLVSSTPIADSTVQRAPRSIVFRFNEPVSLVPGAVRVYDDRGNRVDNGHIHRPGLTTVATQLPFELPRGVYIAVYRVVSADGHPVSGGITFGVREAVRVGRSRPTVAALLDEQATSRVVDVAYTAVRAFHYAALLLLLGALPFWLLTWRAAAGRWPARLLAATPLVGLAAALLGLVLQGLFAAGLGLGSVLDTTPLGDALDTNAGRAWAVRAALWLLAIPLLWARPPWRRLHVAALALVAGALVATLPYAGHAGTQSPRAVLVSADVVHVVAAGAWLGGLALLAAAYWPRGATADGWLATAAFSRTALVAIVVIVAAGVVEAWYYLGSLGAFFDTTYGIVLLVKIVLVGVIVGLGAANRRHIVARSGDALRRAIRIELFVAAGIIVATAILVRTAPPVAAAIGPQARELDVGPMRVELVVEPAEVGPNGMHFYLFDRRTGAQIRKVDDIHLRVANEGADIAPIDVRIPYKGPAHYELLGYRFPAPGTWQATVTVRLSAFDEYSADTTLHVGDG